MLKPNRPLALLDLSWSKRTLETRLAVAYWAAVSALQAEETDDVYADTLDSDDGGSKPGHSTCLSALMVAVVLLFAWAGLRSL
jgi:hypothetical protein